MSRLLVYLSIKDLLVNKTGYSYNIYIKTFMSRLLVYLSTRLLKNSSKYFIPTI